MTRLQRRVAINTGYVGALLIAAVVALDWAGSLEQLENPLYDLRAEHFQYFRKDPTDRLVHLDIDDRAEEVIGRWDPWPRSLQAELLDEIRVAGATVVGLDVLYPERQEQSTVLDKVVLGEKFYRELDHDALLAASIDRLDRVIVPASVNFRTIEREPSTAAAIQILSEDLEMSEADLLKTLRQRGIEDKELETRIGESFLDWRREGAAARVAREVSHGRLTLEDLQARLLKRTDRSLDSPHLRLVSSALDHHDARQTLLSNVPPTPQATLAPVTLALAPIAALSRSATATAFVDYPTSRDGKLRSLPLLVSCEGRLLPQMGMALALQMTGSDLRSVRVTADRIFVSRPDQADLTIPVHTTHASSADRDIPAVFDIPWFGPRRWQEMYRQHPGQRDAHVSMTLVWEAVRARRAIERNLDKAQIALGKVFFSFPDSPGLEKLGSTPLSADRPDPWYALIDEALRLGAPLLAKYTASPPTESDKDAAEFLDSMQALRQVREQNPLLVEQLANQRRLIARTLGGRAVLIGAASTGRLDVVTTSIHPACPGVVAHGVIFNAIMTGDFWWRLPQWVTALATVVCGVAGAVIVGWLPPMRALGAALTLAFLYVLLNGLCVFDYGNRIMGMAAPLMALGLVWAGAMVTRIIIETTERHRVTARFSHYVDPALVQYSMEHPDQVRLAGETRELTVCFTDLVGFTTVAEVLGEKSVALLNEYMGRMVPIIRSERGYLNKFLGDGIMFFFGAPMPDPEHATHAVTTALRMIAALGPLNEQLAKDSLPAISMRVGISTGSMVVGDAGSDDAGDYTVLGDKVNLGARLESVNKRTGTKILMTDNTRQLIGDRFLVRPIGKIQVVGKSEGVDVFEPLAFIEDATPQLRRLAELSAEMVERFQAARFPDCLLTIERLEAEFGPTGLTRLYREECQSQLNSPRTTPFDGRIVITEK